MMNQSQRLKYFGMVSTGRSMRYTPYAIQSFFANTPLAIEDRFFLIDNDSSHEESEFASYPLCERMPHSEPKGFAANLNIIMSKAQAANADLYFLNNDLIFTPDWIQPMLVDTPEILSPLSNREIQYESGDFKCEISLELEHYLGREKHLARIVGLHRKNVTNYLSALFFPFFCVKIPYSIYSVLGPLDESFGKGGAEDNDYCLRAYLNGFKASYAPRSYVLHFAGKSTWSGAESHDEARQREALFRKQFTRKWGGALCRLSIDGDASVVINHPEARQAQERGDIKSMIELLKTSA